MISITNPILTSGESATLVIDQEGWPLVQVSFDVDTNDGKDTWKFYMDPIAARNLSRRLLIVSQNVIEAEIELDRSRKERK